MLHCFSELQPICINFSMHNSHPQFPEETRLDMNIVKNQHSRIFYFMTFIYENVTIHYLIITLASFILQVLSLLCNSTGERNQEAKF